MATKAPTVSEVRRKELSERKTMNQVTKMGEATEEVNLYLVPLRSGAAAAACMDESTKMGDTRALGDTLFKVLDEMVLADKDCPVKLGDMIVGPGSGRESLHAAKAAAFKLRLNGVWVIRVIEQYATYIINRCCATLVASATRAITEPTHELVLPNSFFPSKVIQQVAAQHGLQATCRRVFDSDSEHMYMISALDDKVEKVMKSGLLLTADNVKYDFTPVTRRATLEDVFVYGLSGKGSGERDFVPEFARSFQLSSDLVRLTQAQANPSVGFVGRVRYPYTSERYDAAYELFDAGALALYNPNKPTLKPLEIYVAPSLLELQAVTGIAMVLKGGEEKKLEEKNEEDKNGQPRIVELEPTPAAAAAAGPTPMCVLVPMRVWEARRKAGVEAAARGREWRVQAWMQGLGARPEAWRRAIKRAGMAAGALQADAGEAAGSTDAAGSPMPGVQVELRIPRVSSPSREEGSHRTGDDGAEMGGGETARRLPEPVRVGWVRWRATCHLLGWGWDVRGRMRRGK